MGKESKTFVWDVYGAVVGSKYLGAFTAATSEEAVQKALRLVAETFDVEGVTPNAAGQTPAAQQEKLNE